MLRDSTSSHSTESSAAASDMHEVGAEADRGHQRQRDAEPAGRGPLGVVVLLARGEHDADEGHRQPDGDDGRKPVAGGDARPRPGSATPVALIGATMLIVPMASAR